MLDMGYGKTKQELGQEQENTNIRWLCLAWTGGGEGKGGTRVFFFLLLGRGENTKEPMFVFTEDDEELTLVWWD